MADQHPPEKTPETPKDATNAGKEPPREKTPETSHDTHDTHTKNKQ